MPEFMPKPPAGGIWWQASPTGPLLATLGIESSPRRDDKKKQSDK